MYSVAHTHLDPVFELAQLYKFDMYKRRLNSWVYIWCIELPDNNKYATKLLLQYAEQLTPIND